MKTALSLSTPEEWKNAVNLGADYREVRIDLIRDKSSEEELLRLCREKNDEIPCIATIRSKKEGGNFSGAPEIWAEKIRPWNDCADFIDIERDFSMYSSDIKKTGKKVIASVHLDYMPGPAELEKLEKELRGYGDIPKIVVTPENNEDVGDFLKFTIKSKKPIITSIMGEKFKIARIPLLLFGSMLIYCHSGREASRGQYHITDIKKILELI